MTANHRKDALEVAHITGVQGIRAAMARLADEEADRTAGGRARGGAAGAPHLCRVRYRQRRFPGDLLELRRFSAPGALGAERIAAVYPVRGAVGRWCPFSKSASWL
ncbi:MAG: hypothetical protein ACLUE1_02970 [Adlercreutzia equolifaciens]